MQSNFLGLVHDVYLHISNNAGKQWIIINLASITMNMFRYCKQECPHLRAVVYELN